MYVEFFCRATRYHHTGSPYIQLLFQLLNHPARRNDHFADIVTDHQCLMAENFFVDAPDDPTIHKARQMPVSHHGLRNFVLAIFENFCVSCFVLCTKQNYYLISLYIICTKEEKEKSVSTRR